MLHSLVVLLATSLAAAQLPAAPATPTPLPSVELPPALSRVLRDYEAAWGRSDERALAALFAEDGVVMANGGLPVRGRAAIERHYANEGGSPLVLRAIAFHVEGSTAFILGGYSQKAGDEDIGKFTLVLRRTGERWLVFSDMDNPNRWR